MRTKLLLASILIIGFLLRVSFLDVIPYGFTPDEASFGYDAYSLLLTGKDQWGKTLPLVLESFGDYKMPLYSYISLPFVYLLGLSKFAIRFPNALLGTAALYATFLLAGELLKNAKTKRVQSETYKLPSGILQTVPLLCAFFLAINPWHIMMSRGAFEANLTTFLMPLGAFLFLKGLRNKSALLLSVIIFGLNLFSYHSARLVTPLLVFTLIYLYKSDLLETVKKESFVRKISAFKVPILVMLIFVFGVFYTLKMGAGARARDISIFSGALEEASKERFVAIYQGMSQETARLFHNKFQVVGERFLNNYFQYISPNFLFINGPAEATYGMMPGRGVIYWLELIFLIGFLYSFLITGNKKLFAFILIWVLLAPIPAALSTGRGFAGNRAIVMQPALSIASAIGAYVLYVFLKRLNLRFEKVILPVVYILLTGMVLVFLKDYFLISPYKTSKEMLYGNLEAAEWLNENSQGKQVIMSRSLSEPHIYIAFAGKWNPADYQDNTKEWEIYRSKNLRFLDQMGEYNLGNYKFGDLNFSKHRSDNDIYLVGKPDEFPPDVTPTIRFLYPNSESAVWIVEPQRDAYAGQIN